MACKYKSKISRFGHICSYHDSKNIFQVLFSESILLNQNFTKPGTQQTSD